jgi:hypothetical protein
MYIMHGITLNKLKLRLAFTRIWRKTVNYMYMRLTQLLGNMPVIRNKCRQSKSLALFYSVEASTVLV